MMLSVSYKIVIMKLVGSTENAGWKIVQIIGFMQVDGFMRVDAWNRVQLSCLSEHVGHGLLDCKLVVES